MLPFFSRVEVARIQCGVFLLGSLQNSLNAYLLLRDSVNPDRFRKEISSVSRSHAS